MWTPKIRSAIVCVLTAAMLSACFSIKHYPSEPQIENNEYRVIVLDEQSEPIKKNLVYRFRVEKRTAKIFREVERQIVYGIPNTKRSTGQLKTEYTEWEPAAGIALTASLSAPGFSAHFPMGETADAAGETTVEVSASSALAAFAFLPSLHWE